MATDYLGHYTGLQGEKATRPRTAQQNKADHWLADAWGEGTHTMIRLCPVSCGHIKRELKAIVSMLNIQALMFCGGQFSSSPVKLVTHSHRTIRQISKRNPSNSRCHIEESRV